MHRPSFAIFATLSASAVAFAAIFSWLYRGIELKIDRLDTSAPENW